MLIGYMKSIDENFIYLANIERVSFEMKFVVRDPADTLPERSYHIEAVDFSGEVTIIDDAIAVEIL